MQKTATLSVIHPEATIAENVTIGPFCFIDRDVHIEAGTVIGPNVTIYEGTRIGRDVEIFPGAVIAGKPQDLKYRGEKTLTFIGDRTKIREYVTVNKGTAFAEKTVVGSDCLLMAYVHVAHDCILGDHVVLANNVNLAGHVIVEDWAIIEGQVGVQQFTRIGQHSFIAGGSLVRKSVPPFIRAAREPLSYIGVNKVGLERRNFTADQINRIHDIYRILFVKGFNLSNALEVIEEEIPACEERDCIVRFITETGEKGILRGFQPINGNRVYEDRT